MRIPLSWLKDFVDVELPPEELAEVLTLAGLEVTKIDRVGVAGAELEWDPERVLLAQLLSVEPHPDADRLVLATVDGGAEPATAGPKVVVTGAPNLFGYLGEGDLTDRRLFSPLILEGATYLDPYKDGKPTRLKGRELRGVYNDAMLCSQVELGLGEDHEGIVLFAEDEHSPRYCSGVPLVDVFGDVVLDIDVIPNIARCASILGVAREVAALTGAELRPPDADVVMEGDPVAGRVEIHSESPELNPRFVAILIEGVEQRPAPFWMQHRLLLAGQRPINVVVDISNYVMLEIGQPNHTFDYDFLRRRADAYAPDGPVRLITRLPEPEERLVTLDGAEHRLFPNNILVTDPESNLSLGGIMGGRDSEIQPGTRNVLLEAAAWNFINIRQTQRQLGINTEAGFRFSRGVHPSQAMLGARRAAELLRRLAGGTVAQGIVDHYPQPPESPTIALDPAYVRRLTGLELAPREIASLLERLQFDVTVDGNGDGGCLAVTAPDHRLDVEGPHDLVEEVCRMYGYDRIPSTVMRDTLPPQRGNPSLEREERIKDLLVGQGLQEVITYRLTTPESEARLLADEVDERPYVRIANPSTSERVTLRHSVLASMLEVAAANSRYHRSLALFECGHVYLPEEGSQLPQELPELALLMTGPRMPEHWRGSDSEPLDFYDMKGVLESVMESLGVEVTFAAGDHRALRPGRTARMCVAGAAGQVVELGVLGELHPLLVERYALRIEPDQPVLAAIVDLARLIERVPESFAVEPLPTFPAIREDLALVVDSGLPAAEVERALREAGGALLEAVELFDVYQGDKLEAGRKSLAYHLTFRSASKTLADKDAEKLRNRILREVEKRVGATLRE